MEIANVTFSEEFGKTKARITIKYDPLIKRHDAKDFRIA